MTRPLEFPYVSGVLSRVGVGPAPLRLLAKGRFKSGRDAVLIRTIILAAIVVAPVAAQPRWQLSPRPRLTLGVGNDPATEFTRVAYAFRLSDGTLVVANGATRELRVFGPDGKFRRNVGRDGAGPGEFKLISWAGHLGDTLVVADDINRRATRFLIDGTLVSATAVRGSDPTSSFSWALKDGSWIVSTYTSPRIDGPQRVYRDSVQFGIRRGRPDAPVEWLGSFPGASVVVVNPTNAPHGLLTGFAAFGPVYSFAGGDPLLVGSDDTDSLRVIDLHGRPSTMVRLGILPEPLTDRDIELTRKAAAEGSQARLPESTRRAAEIIYSRQMNPRTRPRYRGLHTEPDGTIWVGPFSPDPAAAVPYRIYDRTGRPIGLLTLPPRFALRDIGADYILGVTTDDDGVERVAVYGLTRR